MVKEVSLSTVNHSVFFLTLEETGKAKIKKFLRGWLARNGNFSDIHLFVKYHPQYL